MADPTGSSGDPEDPGRDRPDPVERPRPTTVLKGMWEGRDGIGERLLAAALTPAEVGFRTLVHARNAAYRSGIAPADASPLPTISIGNITVGGTGKTPVVRWTVQQLRRRGLTPGILHGGYAEDEPALHRRWFPDLPVVADRNRLRGAESALEQGAEVLVLDDAFQHRRLGRDLDVVLVAAETWTRYARLLPRGPYREPPRALRRADMVVVTHRTAGSSAAARAEAEVAHIAGRPTARAHLRASGWLDGRLRARTAGSVPGECVAVAGIARPDDFFHQAEHAGARLRTATAFPDHHPYSRTDAASLQQAAAGRPIVTTAKDAVKLIALMPDVAELWILDQEVVFEAGRERFGQAIQEVLP